MHLEYYGSSLHLKNETLIYYQRFLMICTLKYDCTSERLLTMRLQLSEMLDFIFFTNYFFNSLK